MRALELFAMMIIFVLVWMIAGGMISILAVAILQGVTRDFNEIFVVGILWGTSGTVCGAWVINRLERGR